MSDYTDEPARHVSTRCPRIGEHGAMHGVGKGKWERVLPIPCDQCYSVESRRIPFEGPGTKPDNLPAIVRRAKAEALREAAEAWGQSPATAWLQGRATRYDEAKS